MLGRPAPLPLSFPSVRERCERHPRVRSYTLRLPVNDHAGETVPCLSAWLRHALFAPSAPLFVVTGNVATLLAGPPASRRAQTGFVCTGSARAVCALSATLLVVTGPVAALLAGSSCIAARANRVCLRAGSATSLRSSPAPPASQRAQTEPSARAPPARCLRPQRHSSRRHRPRRCAPRRLLLHRSARKQGPGC